MDLPVWTREELERHLAVSVDELERERELDLQHRLAARYDDVAEAMGQLLDITDDLLDLEAAVEVVAAPSEPNLDARALLDALRLVAMPPVSGEDVEGLGRASQRRVRLSTDQRARLGAVLESRLDRRRFPWLEEHRNATECERLTAICATATLAVGQSLPILSRHVLVERERGFPRRLEAVGWEELPRGVAPRHLAPATFVRGSSRREGPDVICRFADGSVGFIDVKVVAGRIAGSRHPWTGPWRLWTGPPSEVDGEAGQRILVLYGGVPVGTLLDLQAEDVRIVFGHLVDELLVPSEGDQHRSASGAAAEPSPMLRLAEPALADASGTKGIELPEQVVRAAAERILDRLPPRAEVGRLGRRKRPSDPNTYVAQYVHFGFERQPLAIWIYYATADDGYSAPKAGDGYWVGLKQDAARELREFEWADRLAPWFDWVTHNDARWSGFRHYFGDLDAEDDPASAAEEIARWVGDFLGSLGVAA